MAFHLLNVVFSVQMSRSESGLLMGLFRAGIAVWLQLQFDSFFKQKAVLSHLRVYRFHGVQKFPASWNLQGVSRIIIRPHYEEPIVHFLCQQRQSFAPRCADLCRWGSKPISMLKTPLAFRNPSDWLLLIRVCDKPVVLKTDLLAGVDVSVQRYNKQSSRTGLSGVIVLFSCMPRGSDTKTKDATEACSLNRKYGPLYLSCSNYANSKKVFFFYSILFFYSSSNTCQVSL